MFMNMALTSILAEIKSSIALKKMKKRMCKEAFPFKRINQHKWTNLLSGLELGRGNKDKGADWTCLKGSV